MPSLARCLHPTSITMIISHYPLANYQWVSSLENLLRLLCCIHYINGSNILNDFQRLWLCFFYILRKHSTLSLTCPKLKKISLDPHIVLWLHNYLAERQQKVVINGTYIILLIACIVRGLG